MLKPLLLFIYTYLIYGLSPKSLKLKITNKSGVSIELIYIENPKNPEYQSMGIIHNDEEVRINTYYKHHFMFYYPNSSSNITFIKEKGNQIIDIDFDSETNKLIINIVDNDYYKVDMKYVYQQLSNEKITFSNQENIYLMTQPLVSYTNTSAIIEHIRLHCMRYLNNLISHQRTKEKFIECMANNMITHITRLHDRKTEIIQRRDAISSRLRNYTCADSSLETTIPISTHSISLLRNGKEHIHDVNVLLDKSHSKIWYVNEFVTPNECTQLITHGRPKLKRATVAAEDGSSVISEHRKASQSDYTFQTPPEKDPLWELYHRVLNITNYHTGFDLKRPGQEEFTIIQYNEEDQYTPHCDGDCDGSMHVLTGRVATAVLYCKVAAIGGATTFTKSDIIVKPAVNSATFFSYKGLDGRMDDGFTEHSGCPVIQGEKWITTAWMREGVTEIDSWHYFDPSGARMMTSDDSSEDVTTDV